MRKYNILNIKEKIIMKKANKILSVFLVSIMLLSLCSATMWAFATNEETPVVDSGFCGLNGDNLKLTQLVNSKRKS